MAFLGLGRLDEDEQQRTGAALAEGLGMRFKGRGHVRRIPGGDAWLGACGGAPVELHGDGSKKRFLR